MRQLDGRGVERGDVTADVEGVLEGVTVLSDSSESFKSCDLPRQIRKTIGGLLMSSDCWEFRRLFATEAVMVSFLLLVLPPSDDEGGDVLWLRVDEKNLRGDVADDELVVRARFCGVLSYI